MSEAFGFIVSLSTSDANLLATLAKLEHCLDDENYDEIEAILRSSPFAKLNQKISDVGGDIFTPWSEAIEYEDSSLVDRLLDAFNDNTVTFQFDQENMLSIEADGVGSTADDLCVLFLLFLASYDVSSLTAAAHSDYGWTAKWSYGKGGLKLTGYSSEDDD